MQFPDNDEESGHCFQLALTCNTVHTVSNFLNPGLKICGNVTVRLTNEFTSSLVQMQK